MRARSFFYVCAGVLMLFIAFIPNSAMGQGSGYQLLYSVGMTVTANVPASGYLGDVDGDSQQEICGIVFNGIDRI